MCDLLPERDRPMILARVRGAWSLTDPLLAEQRLELLASELKRTWPDAAASLREGMPETLTLMRLGITGQLAKSLCSTNPCESMIEIVRYTQRNVNVGRTATCASAGAPPACSKPSSSSDGSSATATSPSSSSQSNATPPGLLSPAQPPSLTPRCPKPLPSDCQTRKGAVKVPRRSGHPRAHTEHGYQAHALPDLLTDLATLCRNTLRIGPSQHTFTRLTTPTELQATALELLGTKLET